jgi:decaprenylphospho-beta-D-erythro-pentofuranosid-2-ulose 2-reductase
MRDALGGLQSVLVLGGTSEIAAATVERLVADRCRTVILAARDVEQVSEFADRLRSIGATTVETVAFDARDTGQHEKVLGAVFEEHSQIDLVLSAFGVLGNQDEFDAHPDEAAEAIVVNFGGQVSSLLVSADRLRAQGQGAIVVLSSVAGERVRSDNAVYGATKAGLDAFSQALGDRLQGSGVDLMIVRPGFVHTRMTKGLEPAPFSTTPDKVADDIISGLANGREIVWSPSVLRWMFMVLRHLPRGVWRRVAARG